MNLQMPWVQSEHHKDMLTHVRDISLGQVIRDEVLALILRGDLRPGDRITEPAIANKLGVSRVPVREALRDLESTGLVVSRKHTGVFVRQLSWQETVELYELRSVLDAHAGRIVATHSTPELHLLLKEQLEQMKEAVKSKDTVRYYQANLNFHWEIIKAAGNYQISEVYRGVVQKLHIARMTNLSSDTSMLNSLQEHQAIVEAIRSGRPDECAELMANHVQSAGKRLAKSFYKGDDNAKDEDS